ncbi:hypothetical protein ACQJBY_023876 [Aegilops geniculata]
MELTDVCPLCGLEREDTFYVFCMCPRVVDLWQAMAQVWWIPDVKSICNTGPEWFLNLTAECDEGDRLRVLMLMWRCWHMHNEIQHDKTPPPMDVSRRFLQSYVTSLLGIQQYPAGNWDKGKMVIQLEGAKQPISHVDVAGSLSASGARLRKVGRSSTWMGHSHTRMEAPVPACSCAGTTAASFSLCHSLRSCPDPLHAELAGCMEGLGLALQRIELPIILECDSMQAVQMIKTKGPGHSQHVMVVSEVMSLMRTRECCVTHISREQNNVRHVLANFGRTENRIVVWLRSGPANAPSLCRDEFMCS